MKRVLVFVFDGLQMSQVTPDLMPNLAAFAAGGVRFEAHHPVFPTVTRVNSVTMTTGRYPGGHGLAGNSFVDRASDPGRVVPALRPELLEVFGRSGRLLLASNLAGILGGHGEEYVAVGTGSTGNAYLHNPDAGGVGGATVHIEFCEPEGLYEEMVSRFGPWPGPGYPAEERLRHGITVLTEYVLAERDPAVALFWSSEPDVCQHRDGVGSELGIRALGAADGQFERLLAWLEETGRDAYTDVLVSADHGYSTVTQEVKIGQLVAGAGFPSHGEQGGVVVASNGGSVLFYVGERDRGTAVRLASWLMAQPWCGALVAAEALGEVEGTLPAALIGIEGPRGPDLAMSFAWDSRPNRHGYAGHIYSEGKSPGQGNHGSMSRHEQRCALIARGPSFRRGIALQTPSGNVDIAPTVLHVLGLDTPGSMDGRALTEALANGPAPGSVESETETHTAERPVAGGVYRQNITVTRVGKTTYVDEGDARLDAS
jgi:hypothetical protein